MNFKMKPASLAFVVCLFLAGTAIQAQTWELVWSDEFDGPADSLPNSARWDYDLGGGGWGNRELQVYTRSTQNVFLDGDGNLIIRALKDTSGSYTSARLVTREKFEPQFGRVEARIRLPYGQGIWPAFWMLGHDIRLVGWPTCGEVDIMENIGREPSIVHSAMHGPGYSGATPISRAYNLPDGQAFSDDFHTFSIEWSQDSVKFLVDGNLYYSVTPADVPSGKTWVFNKPFFLLLNLAVGGNWPGYPDNTTVFPQTMTVDYVRVFKATDPPKPRRRP